MSTSYYLAIVEEPMVRTYSVDGITCEHCERAIQASVGAVAGVDRVEVDIDHKQVRVGGDASDGAIRTAIIEAGYEVAESV